MTHLSKGEKAPDFEDLPTDGDGTLSLNDFKGRMLVLYFYPKDDTSGCTKEACAFEENLKPLDGCGVSVVGVSKDPVKKHDKFKAKYNLTLPLISDEETDLCERYGVWKEKSMYGRSYMGIERTTFLIDGDGVIQHVWPKVKVNGHVEEVLEIVKGMKAAS